MERLTVRDVCGIACVYGDGNYDEKIKNALNKLADYEDAEEQERLLISPVKVGDHLWKVANLKYPRIDELIVEYYGTDGDDDSYLICTYDGGNAAPNIDMKEIGRSVFKTKEEAQEKIAELNMWPTLEDAIEIIKKERDCCTKECGNDPCENCSLYIGAEYAYNAYNVIIQELEKTEEKNDNR